MSGSGERGEGREHWDVVVVGAGPAGSATALGCARRGLSVLIVEKERWPRWKVCGACLNRGTVGLLEELGIDSIATHREAAPQASLRLTGWGRTADIPLRGSVAVPRTVLDDRLLVAARDAGAAVRLPARATVVDSDGSDADGSDAVVLRVSGDDGPPSISAKVVVAADGLAGGAGAVESRAVESPAGSADAGRVGLGAVFPLEAPGFEPGRIHMAAGPAGYVGAVRTGRGELTVAAALDFDFVRRHGGPVAAVSAHLTATGAQPLDLAPSLGWKGTPILTRHPSRPGGHRVFAVGDAAGYVEPFTGEGMTWALAGALALSPLVERAVEQWQPEHVAEWSALHDRIVGRAQRLCRAVSWCSKRPTLSALAVTVLSRAPGLAVPVVNGAGMTRLHRGDRWAWT